MSNNEDDKKPSKLHWWGGALSGGTTVPYSWALGGVPAAEEGIKGAIVGGFVGLNSLFDNDEDSDDMDRPD